MLDKLKDHINKIIAVPAVLSILTLGANFILSIADDGVIDEQEFHNLLAGASGIESVLLVAVMGILKAITNKKPNQQ